MYNQQKNYDDGHTRECTSCGKMFPKTSKTVTLCKGCNSTRVTSEPPHVRMWRRCKSRAKARGIEFNISKEDIEIPDICPILRMPLVVHRGKPGSYNDSPSLDRKNPNKGYIKGNVWVISSLANVMKNNATEEQLNLFADWVKAGMN